MGGSVGIDRGRHGPRGLIFLQLAQDVRRL